MKTCRPWRPWHVKCNCTTKSCCVTRCWKIWKCRCTKGIESSFKKKKVLPSCSLTRLAAAPFLSFELDSEKAHKLTKMDHRAQILGIELWSSLGDSWKNWRLYIPPEYFTQSWTKAAILIQFYFDLCNCWAARAQHALVYICLKITLVASSAKERKLPLQFISCSFMTHSLRLWFRRCCRH